MHRIRAKKDANICACARNAQIVVGFHRMRKPMHALNGEIYLALRDVVYYV